MWSFVSDEQAGNWRTVEISVEETFRSATRTVNGPCAVGDDGVVVGRAKNGEWGVVVEDGPGADNRALHAVAATDDGKRVWFCGANGALGYYDLEKGERSNESEPLGQTDRFRSIAVVGKRGSEKLIVGSNAGTVVSAVADGEEVRFGAMARPAGATAINGAVGTADGVGYVLDESGDVFRTTAEEGWRHVGVPEAETTYHALDAANGRLYVAGGNGCVSAYDRESGKWTPYDLDSTTFYGLAVDEDVALAVGGSGSVYRWHDDDWAAADTQTGKNLHDAVLGKHPIVVGVSGTALEHTSNVW
ncbi:hypothetical protein [Halospeciosus flavus]|uniref:Uncharacterized protein n=1 Tax=Halospeciosus flavus TaxID=3032283 RepID=A0ABD5Z3Y0_9EURY|nr:hypothetical protein [Halospeciosus flavus]